MITIVTGGARSGKSAFAEMLYENCDDVCYIATSIVSDDEMRDRVAIHRETRNRHWRTHEGYTNLTGAVGREKNYLLDCLTIMTSNIMFDMSKDCEDFDREKIKRIEDRAVSEIKSLIDRVRAEKYNLVIVTNEVGLSIVPENKISRVYRDIIGRVNQRIAALCDEAYLIVMGMEVKLK